MNDRPAGANKSKESGIAPILVIILIVIFIGVLISPQIIKQSQSLIDHANPKKPLSISSFKVPTQTKSYDQLVADGTITKAGKILQVDITYDKAASTPLKITKLTQKNGYAPNVQEVDGEYAAVLLDANNTVVNTVRFAPSVNFRSEQVAENGKEIDSTKTTTTVINDTTLVLPLSPTAKTLQLRTNTGAVITTADIATAQAINNTPEFKTIMATTPLSQAQNSRVLVESTSSVIGQDRYLNIAIIPDSYNDMAQFHNDVTDMWNAMLKIEPFKSRSDQIVFHEVENYKDLGCVKGTTGVGSSCSTPQVIDAVTSAGVPYDYIYVTVDKYNFGGGGGYIAVGSRMNHEFLFEHESLGHSINLLWDATITLEEAFGVPEYFDQQFHSIGKDQYSSPGDGNCFAGTPPAKELESLVKLSDYRKPCHYPNWYISAPGSVMGGGSPQDFSAGCCEAFDKASQATINRRLDKMTGRSTTPGNGNEQGVNGNNNVGSSTCVAPTMLQVALVEPNIHLTWRGSSTPNATYETSVMLKTATGEGTYTVLQHATWLPVTEEEHSNPDPGEYTYKVRAKCGTTYSSDVSISITVPTYTLFTVPPPAGRLVDPNPADVGKYVCGWDANRCSFQDASSYCNNALICPYNTTGRLKICGQFLGCGYIWSVDTTRKEWFACSGPTKVESPPCYGAGGSGQYRFVQPGSNGQAGTELP